MATLLPNAVQQFLSANGVPLAGGMVRSYVPGTFTPKNTWQDSGQTTLNTNPIVLNASGEAVIYGSGIYRQVVFDSAGNQIWDQITSSTDSGTASWGGTSGGSANAQTVTAGSFTQSDGDQVGFIAGFSNTTAATLAVSGGSPIPILRDISSGPGALVGGEIVAGNDVTLVYDTGRGAFHLVNPTYGVISGGTIVGATISSSTINTSTIVLKQASDPAPTAEGDMQWSMLFNHIKVGDASGTQRFLPGPAPGALYGCAIANNSTTAIDFAAGTATDSTNAFYLVNGSTLTKILGTAWAVGNNQGGLFSGAVADGTYHCFVIMRPDTGVVDAGFDTSVTAANRPAAYTYFRRVGSIVRSGGAIVAFTQIGDIFTLNTVSASSSNPTSSSAVTNTLAVPIGVVVRAILYLGMNFSAQPPSAFLLATALFQTDAVPSISNYTIGTAGASAVVDNQTNGTYLEIQTNTSGQIRTRLSSANAGIAVLVSTVGWIDNRGRL